MYVAPLCFAFRYVTSTNDLVEIRGAFLTTLHSGCRKDPLFAVTIQYGVICIFKSYSALGDFALWHTLLVAYSELHTRTSSRIVFITDYISPRAHSQRSEINAILCSPDLATPLLLISLTLYSLCLFPTFHHLWLYSGSGNANFFYASTLVWAISQGGILLDFLSAKGRREILGGLGEKGRALVRGGTWKVVQK